MTRLVFMGTPDFAVPALEKLIATQEVVGVVTQPDRPAGRGKQLRPSPVKVAALAAGLPLFQPSSLRKVDSAEKIRQWQPDAIIVAAFGQILRSHLLDFPKHGCINVHASLLPRWRGASPIQHAILAGDAESGVCLMKMEVGLDTGPVYTRGALPLAPDETAQSLHDKLATLGGELLERDLPAILAGKIIPTPQDDDRSTYAPMIKKQDGVVAWGDSAEKIHQKIRAFSPWPSAFTRWNDKQLKLLSATVRPASTIEPGVVALQDNAVLVGTGQGALVLDRIQLQGKKAMAATDFARGRQTFIGAQLK